MNSSARLSSLLLLVKKQFTLIFLISAFVNLLLLVPAIYMLQLYDRVVTSRSEETLLMLTLLLLVLFASLMVLDWARNRIMSRLANQFDQKLQDKTFDGLIDWAKKEPNKASSLPAKDLMQLRQFIASPGLVAFFDAPWIPIFIGLLFLFHFYYGLFAVFAFIVMVILLVLSEKRTRKPQEQANGLQQQSVQMLNSTLSNYEVAHSMGMTKVFKQKWSEMLSAWLISQTQANDRAQTLQNLSKYLRMLFQSLILGIGAYLVINMELTPGMMIAGSIILGRALAPLDTLTSQWKSVVGAREAYGRLQSLLAQVPPEQDKTQLPDPKGVVDFEGVSIIPPGAEKASIKNVSFHLDAGQSLGVLGASGSGKTSLIRGLLAVWPCLTGKVRLDGADIQAWSSESLGPHIGYLPQDIDLFAGTVAQNICRFGDNDSEKIVAAAQLAGVHHLILRLPQGYDTVIGDKGHSLSGGQRQRIALARAVYGSPKLVVLDEPNSNLDDEGDRALYQALQHLKAQQTTVLIISHQLPILQGVDQILLLKDGQLAQWQTAREFFTQLQQKRVAVKQASQAQTPSSPQGVTE